MKIDLVTKSKLVTISDIKPGNTFIWDGTLYIRIPDTKLVINDRTAVGVNLDTGNHLVIDPTSAVDPIACKVIKA